MAQEALSAALNAALEYKRTQNWDGVVLALDDLQWADDLTTGWLEFLLQSGRLQRTPMLVLGTYRIEEVGAAGCSPLQALLEEPRLRRVDGPMIASLADGRLAPCDALSRGGQVCPCPRRLSSACSATHPASC